MVNATTGFRKKKGSREEVWKGVAQETSGGLRKKDLMISKTGTLVSKKASQAAKNRMKKGKGLCGYCIDEYKRSIKVEQGTKNSTKKSIKKKSIKKKSIKKKVELKFKKVKGASEKKVKEFEQEIEKLLAKAGRVVNRTGKETAESRKLLEQVHKKRVDRLKMVKTLKAKKKNSVKLSKKNK